MTKYYGTDGVRGEVSDIITQISLFSGEARKGSELVVGPGGSTQELWNSSSLLSTY